MEPPCEHGGVGVRLGLKFVSALLQWSRRVNTAECCVAPRFVDHRRDASMEPPCEHGGVLPGRSGTAEGRLLQWSRRVNTAE